MVRQFKAIEYRNTKTYTILLCCGTVGTYKSHIEPQEGEGIAVTLGDENGHSIKVNGVVAEVLEVSEY